MKEMSDIYELISKAYDKCAARLKDAPEGLESETLQKVRFLQSQASDIILDYRREIYFRKCSEEVTK